MRKLKIIFIIFGMLFLTLFGIRTYNGYRFYVEKQTRFMMDTYVTIYAVGPKKITSPAVASALNRMQEIDTKFNSLNPKSPVYAFNHNNIAITDPEILGLVQIAVDVSRKFNGAFDITVAPLVELWGFYSKSYRLPKDEEIKECLNRIGYQHLLFNKGKLEKDNPDVRIDLGGIAKGYALSEAVKVLKREGVFSALVDAGGDVYALGKKGGRLWKIGIKHPRQEGILGYVEVEDLVVVGSGDYERFFKENEKRYHHIFNPKTGYPTEGVISVTIIYSNPVSAQAWTKIPFVLGPQKGLELLEKIPGMEAIIVTASGEKIYSSGLKHTLNVITQNQ